MTKILIASGNSSFCCIFKTRSNVVGNSKQNTKCKCKNVGSAFISIYAELWNHLSCYC